MFKRGAFLPIFIVIVIVLVFFTAIYFFKKDTQAGTTGFIIENSSDENNSGTGIENLTGISENKTNSSKPPTSNNSGGGGSSGGGGGGDSGDNGETSRQNGELQLLNFQTSPVTNITEKYEKFEISFNLAEDASYSNKYDSDIIKIDGYFTSPSGKVYVQPGFWYQNYVRTGANDNEILTASGLPLWKIRFAPTEIGEWSYTIVAIDANWIKTSLTYQFNAQESRNPGFIRVSQQDNRYFAYENGTVFYGNMLDLCWHESAGPHRQTYSYDYWISEMKVHKANFFRIWNYNMVNGVQEGDWIWHIQDSQAGANYDQKDSWRMDYVVEQARKNNIYIMLTFDDVNELIPGNKWENNLYSNFLSNPGYFFTNSQAKELHKRLYRYYIARYGYSTSILAWELWNEVNEAPENPDITTTEAQVDAWHVEMAQYFKSIDPYKHLVTTSDGSLTPPRPGRDWNLPELEFSQMHGYVIYNNPNDWQDNAELVRSYSQYILGKGKPAIWGENGVWGITQAGAWQEACCLHQNIDNSKSHCQEIECQRYDTNGLAFHNGMWAGLMRGLASTTPYWDWYLLRDAPAWWDNHLYIGNFIEGINFIGSNYQYVNNRPSGTITPIANDTSNNLLMLGQKNNTNGIFWIHNKQNNFGNVIMQGNTPTPIPTSTTITISGFNNGNYNIEWWDTWTGNVVGTTIRTVNSSGNLVFNLGDVSWDRTKDVALKIRKIGA